MNASSKQHTIPASFVGQLIEVVRHWDITPDQLLSGTEFTTETTEDPHARLPLAAYLPVVDRARTLTGEPGLGFCMGLQARVSAYGYLGFAAMSAATVRDALELAVKFSPMVSTAFGLRLNVQGGVAALIAEENADFGNVRDVVIISRLAGLWRMALALTGRDLQGTAELAFPEPPYHARFAHLMPPTRYGQPMNQIVLSSRALDVPLIMADPAALRLAQEQCERALDELSSGGRIIGRVRRLVWRDEGIRTLPEMAKALDMSPRTLKRKLAAQGTSVSTIVAEERRDKALVLLRSSELSIEAIASRLGYWSVQNFTRAFRLWTGRTPAVYRREPTSGLDAQGRRAGGR
jgi:AraC-like DNA-binding protein